MKKSKVAAICLLLVGALMGISCWAAEEPFYVLDGDPGTDDTFAIFLFAKGGKEAGACLSCFGNKPLTMTHRNMLIIQKYLGLKAKIYTGAVKPIASDPPSCGDFHGKDGLAGVSDLLMGMLQVQDPGTPVPDKVQDIANDLMKHDNIVYLSFGPLTNLAQLISAEPGLKKHISKVYLMGGGLKHFNMPHDTEYNFFADPAAVEKVLSSGLDITIFPLDITEKYPIPKAKIELLTQNSKHPALIMCLYRNYLSNTAGVPADRIDEKGAIIHDTFPVLYLLHPEKFTIVDKKLVCDKWGHIAEDPQGNLIHVGVEMHPDTLFQALEKGLSEAR